MQDFNWAFKYSGIFMVWVTGYLGEEALVAFLSKAKDHLLPAKYRVSRREAPESFIIVMDNVLENGGAMEPQKEQSLRTVA